MGISDCYRRHGHSDSSGQYHRWLCLFEAAVSQRLESVNERHFHHDGSITIRYRPGVCEFEPCEMNRSSHWSHRSIYTVLVSPFAAFLMTTYFRGVPDELLEASVVDGLSYGRIFIRIMLPMAIPALFTIAVLQFIQVWDDLLVAMLFLPNPAVRTITVGLATLQAQRIVNIPVLMAGSFVSALPAVIVYLIFQRSLINGLTMGMGK